MDKEQGICLWIESPQPDCDLVLDAELPVARRPWKPYCLMSSRGSPEAQAQSILYCALPIPGSLGRKQSGIGDSY